MFNQSPFDEIIDKYAKYFDFSHESPTTNDKYNFDNVTRRPNNGRSSSPPLPCLIFSRLKKKQKYLKFFIFKF